MCIEVFKHLRDPLHVVIKALWAPEFLDVEFILVFCLKDILHGKPDAFTAAVVNTGHIPAMLSGEEDIVIIRLPHLF